MKAMMLTGIRKMEMQEVTEPEIVNDTDVKIKMMVVGICGSDIHYYTSGKIGSQIVQYPFPVGHEGAGIVVDTGSKVKSLKKGDRIAIEPAMPCGECDQCKSGRANTCRKMRFLGCPGQAGGCLLEYIVMPESSCLLIPASLSFDQAAISEPLAIGIYSVQKAMPLKDLKIGILGFGPIGMSVLLPAKVSMASRIYVTDKIEDRLAIASKAGAHWTGNVDRTDVVNDIKALEPLLLDVVFECCGKQEALDQAFRLLKPGGKLIMIGIPEFDHWMIPADVARRNEICIQNIRRQVDCAETAIKRMAGGSLDVSLMPTHRFNFGDTQKAFNLVAGYQDGVMKAMIDF